MTRGSGQKICVVVVVLRPIIVLSLAKAEQFTFHKNKVSYNVTLSICAELQIVARAVVAEF